ncbi:MAG TPA: PA0069 family radical SAM protein [Polyangiaceae bacterium]|nr:PA0069 family radical SAM protein [Polyangiaceae bacterium]
MRRLPLENPLNRFERHHVEYEEGAPDATLEVYDDASQSILSENDSPDIGFRFSVNPDRGCLHGCAYCYARPSHEYLGFGSGSDFERKLVVKRRAPELLAQAFDKKSWRGELVVFSGNTDCYQPLEKSLELTRGCLAVCARYRNPVHVITKSALVERDIDLLTDLAAHAHAGVTLSIPFLGAEVARAMEPYAPPPSRRIEAVRRLAAAGINVSVNIAPVIPGLNDRDIVPILEAVRDAGASGAAMVPLRLPGSVAEVFTERLRAALPLAAEKILTRVREMRGGKLNDSSFGTRMQGTGRYIETVSELFDITVRRLGLDHREPSPRASTFRRPGPQLSLFDR